MSTSAASRPPNGRVNVHEPSDYPILLGDSFKNKNNSDSRFLQLRYNWEPRQGFSGQTGTLQRNDGRFRVTYAEDGSESPSYDYNATLVNDSSYDGEDQPTRLVLVFDPAKSAYVLEQISKSFNLNLASARDQSKEEVRQHKQIEISPSEGRAPQINVVDEQISIDDETADPSNPFDFRNFLSEARDNAEKALQPTGNHTPIPGNRTPLNGFSSPSLGPSRLHATNSSQFRPTPTSAPAPKKTLPNKPTTSGLSKDKKLTKRKPATTKTQTAPPLSSEIVVDSSDEEVADTTNLARSAVSDAKDQSNNDRKVKHRTSSVVNDRSPHVMVNDGGLEIDMGSPSPDLKPRAMLDIEAFRSQTHTPTWGHSSNKRTAPQPDQDTDMRDRSEEEDQLDEDEDEEDNDHRPGSEQDVDEDVDDLALNSPRSKRTDERIEETEKAPSPPMPPPSRPPEEDEDEDALARELLLVLDDESEVSEEE